LPSGSSLKDELNTRCLAGVDSTRRDRRWILSVLLEGLLCVG
jgi:hypothetical protein